MKENIQIDSTASEISVDFLKYSRLYTMNRKGIICEFKDLHCEENYCFIYKEYLQKGVVYDWGLRNILVFLHRRLPGKKIKILVIRGDNREIFEIRFPEREPNLSTQLVGEL